MKKIKGFLNFIVSKVLPHGAWGGVAAIVTILTSVFGVKYFVLTGYDEGPSVTTEKEEVQSNQYAGNLGKTWIEPNTNMEFVWVTGGCYEMGITKEEKSDLKNYFQNDRWYEYVISKNFRHSVCVDGFWIGKYEVTQGQWIKLLGKIKAPLPENISYGLPPEGSNYDDLYKVVQAKILEETNQGGNFPVGGIWHSNLFSEGKNSFNTHQFINELNFKNNNKYFFRLPTEAEWEYACRSGGKDEIYSGGNNLDLVGWYEENSLNTLQQSGLKSPNGLGIYDMSGGVSEWVVDTCDGDSYLKHGYKNPVRVSDGVCQGLRGGGFKSEAYQARCTMRWGSDSGSPTVDSGFRLVMIPE